MRVRLISLGGQKELEEVMWDKPSISFNEICVKAVMTGVCTSDIAMMEGKFKQLPLCMQGHEGLGIVTEVGQGIKAYIKEGDYVATRGEPAYADYYNSKLGDFVKVPELLPKYILEPIACGANIITANLNALQSLSHKNNNLLIHGSGFMAWCVYNAIKHYKLSFNIDVVGNHNHDLWNTSIQLKNVDNVKESKKQYNIIIELNPNNFNFIFDSDGRFVNNNALLIVGCPKQITTDFSDLLWKNCTINFPSPRSNTFHTAMQRSLDMILEDDLNVDYFWTKEYNRNTEWKDAFLVGKNRPIGYNRGYIKWD